VLRWATGKVAACGGVARMQEASREEEKVAEALRAARGGGAINPGARLAVAAQINGEEAAPLFSGDPRKKKLWVDWNVITEKFRG